MTARGRKGGGNKRKGWSWRQQEEGRGWAAAKVVEGREVRRQGCAALIPCCKKEKLY